MDKMICFFGGVCDDAEAKYKNHCMEALGNKSYTPRPFVINMIVDCSEPFVSTIPYHVWCFLVHMDGSSWTRYLKSLDDIEQLEEWRCKCLEALFRIQSKAEHTSVFACMERWAFYITQRLPNEYLNIDFYRRHHMIFKTAFKFDMSVTRKSGGSHNSQELMFEMDPESPCKN